MKIRVVIMTENDKHVDMPKEKIEEMAKVAWEMYFKLLTFDNPSDRATIESCELIEP